MKKETYSKEKSITRRETISVLSAALLGISTAKGKTFSENKIAQLAETKEIKADSPMKTIGILGGLGPQATIDLESRIHKVAQQLIAPAQNSGYPTMVVHYYRHPPILLTTDFRPAVPWQPDPRILEVAASLGRQVDFILIPSNGAHLFQKEIENAANCKVLSMIDITLNEVVSRRWKKTGVLGLMEPTVYTSPMKKLDLDFQTIDPELQQKLNQAIFKVMEGREEEADRAIAFEAVTQLRKKNVDGIIPGCTELPILLGDHMNSTDMLNPAQLLAQAAVKFAIGE